MRGGALGVHQVRVRFPLFLCLPHRREMKKPPALKKKAQLTLLIVGSSCERTQPVLLLPSKLTSPLPSLYLLSSPFCVHPRRLDQEERKVEGPLVDLMVGSLAPNPQKTIGIFFIFLENPPDCDLQEQKVKIFIKMHEVPTSSNVACLSVLVWFPPRRSRFHGRDA